MTQIVSNPHSCPESSFVQLLVRQPLDSKHSHSDIYAQIRHPQGVLGHYSLTSCIYYFDAQYRVKPKLSFPMIGEINVQLITSDNISSKVQNNISPAARLIQHNKSHTFFPFALSFIVGSSFSSFFFTTSVGNTGGQPKSSISLSSLSEHA